MTLTRKNKIWLGAAIAVVIAIIGWRLFRPSSKTEYFTANVSRGDIREVVEATGTINAVITVQVGSQVSGTISQLFADFNSHVKKNQVIARIEPSLFQGALLQAKADLENARANAAAAKASAAKAKATAVQAQAQFERSKALAAQGVVSQQQLDLDRAAAEADAAEAAATEAQVGQAQAQASQKAAAVTVAQTNLDHTIIRSPIDGTVVSRNIDVGQTVAASLQAPTLFVIAQDLTKMQVYAKTDESDVGQIRAGQPANFTVDAFPKETFRGRVEEVRMNATTVQNVVTYDTIVDFDNPDTKLFPGMTAYVSIPVAVAQDVLRVPNGALRYKPDLKPEQIQRLYAKVGIEAPVGGGRNRQTQARQQGSSASGTVEAAGLPPKQTPQSGGANRSNLAILWKLLPDKSLEPVQVQTGITDHTQTEVAKIIHGSLDEGAQLVTGSAAARASGATAAPGMGGPGAGRVGR